MHYGDREDYRLLKERVLNTDRHGSVVLNKRFPGTSKPGVVLSVRCKRMAVRITCDDPDDAFEAAQAALSELL